MNKTIINIRYDNLNYYHYEYLIAKRDTKVL